MYLPGRVDNSIEYDMVLLYWCILVNHALCLLFVTVMQGAVGSVPLNAMTFLLLLWSWRGFDADSLGVLLLVPAAGGLLGQVLGG